MVLLKVGAARLPRAGIKIGEAITVGLVVLGRFWMRIDWRMKGEDGKGKRWVNLRVIDYYDVVD